MPSTICLSTRLFMRVIVQWTCGRRRIAAGSADRWLRSSVRTGDHSMAITDWPAEDRPREKLLAYGAGALTDAELLAIFLRVGVAGLSAVDLPRLMLDEHGSLAALMGADQARFCQTRGLGSAKYAQLQAVREMARRHTEEALKTQGVLSDPDATRRYLALHLARLPHE